MALDHPKHHHAHTDGQRQEENNVGTILEYGQFVGRKPQAAITAQQFSEVDTIKGHEILVKESLFVHFQPFIITSL